MLNEIGQLGGRRQGSKKPGGRQKKEEQSVLDRLPSLNEMLENSAQCLIYPNVGKGSYSMNRSFPSLPSLRLHLPNGPTKSKIGYLDCSEEKLELPQT
jgi:hypothetical protein